MAHGQGPKGGTWTTVRNTVRDHVPPPPPPLGLASYSTQQLMDAQAWMDLTKCTLPAGLRHDAGY